MKLFRSGFAVIYSVFYKEKRLEAGLMIRSTAKGGFRGGSRKSMTAERDALTEVET